MSTHHRVIIRAYTARFWHLIVPFPVSLTPDSPLHRCTAAHHSQKGEFIDLHLHVGGESDFGRETRCIGMHRIVAALISDKFKAMIDRDIHSGGCFSGQNLHVSVRVFFACSSVCICVCLPLPLSLHLSLSLLFLSLSLALLAVAVFVTVAVSVSVAVSVPVSACARDVPG